MNVWFFLHVNGWIRTGIQLSCVPLPRTHSSGWKHIKKIKFDQNFKIGHIGRSVHKREGFEQLHSATNKSAGNAGYFFKTSKIDFYFTNVSFISSNCYNLNLLLQTIFSHQFVSILYRIAIVIICIKSPLLFLLPMSKYLAQHVCHQQEQRKLTGLCESHSRFCCYSPQIPSCVYLSHSRNILIQQI